MTFISLSSNSLTSTHRVDWGYTKSALPQQIFPQPSIEIPLKEDSVKFEKPKLATGFFQKDQYELTGSVRPYLPPSVTKTLEKWAKRPLTDKQAITVMKEIAEISIEFYKVQEGKYVAIGFDGRIVESANTSLDLLLKIQGRKYPFRTFVWHVGSDVFAGWGI